jgi:hypothetical protein
VLARFFVVLQIFRRDVEATPGILKGTSSRITVNFWFPEQEAMIAGHHKILAFSRFEVLAPLMPVLAKITFGIMRIEVRKLLTIEGAQIKTPVVAFKKFRLICWLVRLVSTSSLPSP